MDTGERSHGGNFSSGASTTEENKHREELPLRTEAKLNDVCQTSDTHQVLTGERTFSSLKCFVNFKEEEEVSGN